uniref:RING-type E3 ubiquitin transferase n=1 Tax=Melopsittacus undulatus TaxID=13146 RepID=A0A8C6JMA0_MELUD
MKDCCPICLGNWKEVSYVMPCHHQFCYQCILQWAETKPECPLCKRGIQSILHSVLLLYFCSLNSLQYFQIPNGNKAQRQEQCVLLK